MVIDALLPAALALQTMATQHVLVVVRRISLVATNVKPSVILGAVRLVDSRVRDRANTEAAKSRAVQCATHACGLVIGRAAI